MKIYSLICSLLIMTLFSTQSHAQNWCTLTLQGAQAGEVEIVYRVLLHESYRAIPLRVNFRKPGLTGLEKVQLMVMPWTFDQRAGTVFASPNRRNLLMNMKFNSSLQSFSVEVPEGLAIMGPGLLGYFHEFAIVIDGRWFKNRLNGNNFRVDLYGEQRRQGRCTIK